MADSFCRKNAGFLNSDPQEFGLGRSIFCRKNATILSVALKNTCILTSRPRSAKIFVGFCTLGAEFMHYVAFYGGCATLHKIWKVSDSRFYRNLRWMRHFAEYVDGDKRFCRYLQWMRHFAQYLEGLG